MVLVKFSFLCYHESVVNKDEQEVWPPAFYCTLNTHYRIVSYRIVSWVHFLCQFPSTVWVKKFYLPRFSKIYSQWLRIFKQNFTCLLYVHIYGKLHNFIQLSLNLTRLYHIQCDHPVNFHFSLEFELFNSLTYVAPVLSQSECSTLLRKAAANARWRLQTVASVWIHIPARRVAPAHMACHTQDWLRTNCIPYRLHRKGWTMNGHQNLTSTNLTIMCGVQCFRHFTNFT